MHYMDHINRLVRGSKTPAPMPRISGVGASASAGAAKSSREGSSRGGKSKGSDERDNDGLITEFDPLTGEPLDSSEIYDGKFGGKGKVGAAKAGAATAGVPTHIVSPRCEEKVDYDIIVDLVDYIMIMEAREAAKKRSPSSGAGAGADGANWRQGDQHGQGRSSTRNRAGRARDTRAHGVAEEPLGAILVFLPGFAEIDQLTRALQRHQRIGQGSRIFPLHSTLPSHQQKAIFQRMPPGVRKIVVSTNIAETSVSAAVFPPFLSIFPFIANDT